MNGDNKYIIQELLKNRAIFETLLSDRSSEQYLWKQNTDKWCLLEIISHLYDEEIEDFRARTKSVLETPTKDFVAIDPVGWVKDRNYLENDYEATMTRFLLEREHSVNWLHSLDSPQWNNVHHHPQLGSMTANQFLSNWLAHDYLHIRQIIKLKFDYLKCISGENLNYAGDW